MSDPGWAVRHISRDAIFVKTVCDTRRGAIINWLVTECGVPVTKYHTDADIERIWKSLGQYVEVGQVTVTRAK